jgi:coenzyme Q-binding protein COQ10
VNYSPTHVYKVVADVERYQEFVPWCTKSKIVEEISPKEKLADLTVGFYGLSEETFRSHVVLEPYHSVTALASSDLYSQSPLKRLKNVWTFEPSDDNRTKVSMKLEFEFHNPLYTRLTGHFLKRISSLAMSSFVARCALVKDDIVQDPAEPGACPSSREAHPKKSATFGSGTGRTKK